MRRNVTRSPLPCRRCPVLLLLAGLVIQPWSATFAATNPFLPERATVVLLAGLPGDLESEVDYRNQLNGWLGFLATNAVERVFVLTDNPPIVMRPTNLAVKVSEANRREFLALGKTLAGQTNPLVVVVWGHGGMQGQTPVFHVRGPRLTPEDFKAFAAQAPAASGRWLLFFRGSSRFARELAAENRELVSSDHDQSFSSDPIGLPLLLATLHREPVGSVDATLAAFGRAVAAWYEKRGLVRTEEPTLWAGTQPPRALATGGEAPALESAVKPDVSPSNRTAEPPATAKAPAELPAAWRELKRVEPSAYPGHDAVALQRRIAYTLRDPPAITMEHEEFIQVLTAEGKRFGDFDVPYSPARENLSFLDCEVLRPDGRLVRMDLADIHEMADETVGDYPAGRRIFFSLPGVEPGAILHVRYQSAWNRYPLPHIWLEIPLATEIPAREAPVQVTVGKDLPFHFALEQIASVDPTIKQTVYGSTYTWPLRDVPARTAEPLAPPDAGPALLVSTFPDWFALAEWYARITQQVDEITPEISAKAAELTRTAANDREKVLALYNYVTGLRYVAVPIGINSFRPREAARTLKNQFGDCKDKATLFNTLLRSLKFDAHLVLVPRFKQARENLPGLAFNHAISRVQLGGETLWVDTTDDVCRFGMLPPGDPGRRVLVIDGESKSLTALPSPALGEHRLSLRGRIHSLTNTADPAVSLHVTARGYPDYELRSAAQDAEERKPSMPLLARHYRPAAGVFALERQTFTPASALDTDYTWEAEGRCVGSVVAQDGRVTVAAPFWLPKEFEVAVHRRESALFLQQGYPLTLQEEFEWPLPPGTRATDLPPLQQQDQPPLRWKLAWSQPNASALAARLELELASGELSPAETPRLQQQLRELFAALGRAARVTVSGSAPPIQ